MSENADEQSQLSLGKIIAIFVATILVVVLGYVAWFMYQLSQLSDSLSELSGAPTAEESFQEKQAEAMSAMLEVCPWIDSDEPGATDELDDFVALIHAVDDDLGGGNKKQAVNFEGVGAEMRDSFGVLAGERAYVTAYRCLCGNAPGVAQAYLGGGESWWQTPPVDPGPNAVEYVFQAEYSNDESAAFFGGNESRIERFERAVADEGMRKTSTYEGTSNTEASGYSLIFGPDEGLLKTQSFPFDAKGNEHTVEEGRSMSLRVFGKNVDVSVRSGCLPAGGETFEQAKRSNDARLEELELQSIPAAPS